MDKPTFGEKFRALLATGRVANLPTVWSNVLVGGWLSSYFVFAYHDEGLGFGFRVSLMIIITLVASMIYVGGCMLGDAKDIDFDRENRPNRPLPKGILSVGFVKITSYCLLILATFGLFCSTLVAAILLYLRDGASLNELLAAFVNRETLHAIQIHEMILGLLLVTAVVTYAFHHKKNKVAALLLMASCRFLLVMLAIGVAQKTFLEEEIWLTGGPDPLNLYTGWLKGWMIVYAATVGIYTLLLSWVASTESKPGPFQARKIMAALLLALPLVSLYFNTLITAPNLHLQTAWGNSDIIGEAEISYYLACTIIIFYLWLIYALWRLKSSKPGFVSCALAGFCLLDACFAVVLAPGIALICLGLFVLALLLQRITPAT